MEERSEARTGVVTRDETPDAAVAAWELRAALVEALAHDDAKVRRVRRSGSTVRFAIGDGEHGATLLLDRSPPIVLADDEPAEVEIRLTAEQALALSCGNLPMPAAIVSGDVGSSGPVRRYLEVDPILQSLLHELADADHPRPARASAIAAATRPDSAVLAIETRDLAKAFGPHQVLDGVDLTIPEGVISVVLGPSGTGKSVLLQHIIGLLRPDRGEVRVRGRALTGMSGSELMLLRREIGVMFQDGALFSGMDVFDNVAFPLREHTDLDDDDIEEIVMSRLREVGLEFAADRLPAQLSGGMKKRAGLARALVLDPAIVLCDEPDSGLDPVRTALLADLLVEQHANGGGCMLVVTHDIALAKRVADHISILWNGRILQSGMAEDIFASDDPFVRQFLAGEVDGPLTME
jgi:phospholipid/cholesterol/gamma-HCH transport system ATP-binding protein